MAQTRCTDASKEKQGVGDKDWEVSIEWQSVTRSVPGRETWKEPGDEQQENNDCAVVHGYLLYVYWRGCPPSHPPSQAHFGGSSFYLQKRAIPNIGRDRLSRRKKNFFDGAQDSKVTRVFDPPAPKLLRPL